MVGWLHELVIHLARQGGVTSFLAQRLAETDIGSPKIFTIYLSL